MDFNEFCRKNPDKADFYRDRVEKFKAALQTLEEELGCRRDIGCGCCEGGDYINIEGNEYPIW